MLTVIRSAAILLLFSIIFPLPSAAQKLVSEPIQGHTTPHSIRVWTMVKGGKSLEATLGGETKAANLEGLPSWRGNIPVEIEWKGLRPEAEYPLSIKVDGTEMEGDWAFRTMASPSSADFSFTVGSCFLYGTGPMRFVRPGSFTKIFDAMIATPADFNIWLGDNVYLLLNEWNSVGRTYKKYSKVRLGRHTNAFLRSRPQYAILDDHDFGPDNSGSGFENKDMTSRCFNDFWPNPLREDAAKGNYSQFSFQDCDFFLLDGRYHRIAEGRKQMYGPEQIEWLKSGLRESKATFKFIATGSQSLSEVNQGETWADYPEKKDFIEFLKAEKIEGVVFMSGDRHFTEMMKLEQPGCYPLHELTCSPLTSLLRRKPLDPKDPEHVNPLRVEGTMLVDHNFGKISVIGAGKDRACRMEIMDAKGKVVWTQVVMATDLRF